MKNFKTVPKSIEDNVIKIQSRYMSDPTLSDINLKNKLLRYELSLIFEQLNEK